MKQDLGWEKLRLSIYTKLKNYNMLLTIGLYFGYSCKDIIEKIAVSFPKLICFRAKEWAKLKKFIYCRLSKAIKICISSANHYDTSPH